MDNRRYENDPVYRARIDAARKGGQARSERKRLASAGNGRRSGGRPRADGAAPGRRAETMGAAAPGEPVRGEEEPWWAEPRGAQYVDRAMRRLGWSLEQEANCSRVADGAMLDLLIAIGGDRGPRWARVFWEWSTLHGKSPDVLPMSVILEKVARFRAAGRTEPPADPLAGFEL